MGCTLQLVAPAFAINIGGVRGAASWSRPVWLATGAAHPGWRPRHRSWRATWLPGGEAAPREESAFVRLILISTRDRPGDANQPLNFPSAPGFRSPPHLTGFLDLPPVVLTSPIPSPGCTHRPLRPPLYFCACAYLPSPPTLALPTSEGQAALCMRWGAGVR